MQLSVQWIPLANEISFHLLPESITVAHTQMNPSQIVVFQSIRHTLYRCGGFDKGSMRSPTYKEARKQRFLILHSGKLEKLFEDSVFFRILPYIRHITRLVFNSDIDVLGHCEDRKGVLFIKIPSLSAKKSLLEKTAALSVIAELVYP